MIEQKQCALIKFTFKCSEMKLFYLCLLIVLIAYLAAPCKAEREGGHGVHRIKRHVCRDGFENFEGRNCCRCSPGYFTKTPCTPSSETVCEPCPGGTYLEHTNFRESCEPCKICDDKANMESKEQCNPRQNTICTCQNGYYCDKEVQEECKACHPCKTCEKGFEVEKSCTSTNNTVCRKAAEEVGQGWIWILVSLVLLVIGVAAAAFSLQKEVYRCTISEARRGKPRHR
ncbi:hypothetical protein AGOR_G00200470 [Albula goreensis]|uniref:TNFR-Cys domain-containing protein n=1 Tax=Albula goreensis TaxID=1534307 RepID=A0A8T3CP47_9TELE|nr:hypothetical protein AGOR_G00200470 [Albula goreensis]